jgi:hypothetical protein
MIALSPGNEPLPSVPAVDAGDAQVLDRARGGAFAVRRRPVVT